MNKRRMLCFGAVAVLLLLTTIVSCAPQTVEVEKLVTQVVKEQVTVFVEGETRIEEIEKVVTVTPSAPVEISYTYPGPGVPNDLQMVEDANYALNVLNGDLKKRERPWMA